jgi:hypothetical protein
LADVASYFAVAARYLIHAGAFSWREGAESTVNWQALLLLDVELESQITLVVFLRARTGFHRLRFLEDLDVVALGFPFAADVSNLLPKEAFRVD